MSGKNWAPARIWLQREQGDHGSHTWCEDSVGDGDIIEEAEYVRVDAAVQMALCSTEQVFLKPNQLYRFYVKDGCPECARIADPVDTPASQPKALTDTMLEKLYWTAMNNAADILKFMDEGRALLEAK
jgi:hypothetical protein